MLVFIIAFIFSLLVSKNLTKISDRAFEKCTGLTSVILPESITTIEGNYTDMYRAFGNCTNLTKILVPDNVSSIGIGAFQGCEKLTIYGNDGKTSKKYAEEHKISFDYIANWNKQNSGKDITAPTVKSIQVAYESVKNYNKDSNKNMYMVTTGAKLAINVNFSENVVGKTVPTLTIKFGDESNIKVTEGTIGDSTITYIYTVKNTDKGIMTAVDLSGGSIKDATGNSAKLSFPALSVQGNSKDIVYANETASSTANSNNNSNNNKNNNSNNKDNSNKDNSNKNTDTTKKEDNTVASKKLPQTGLTMGMIMTIVLVLAGGVFTYFKYGKLKGI